MIRLKLALFCYFLLHSVFLFGQDDCTEILGKFFHSKEVSIHSVAELKNEYLDYSATNIEQNREWIEIALNGNAHTYLDVENAALKRLNDSLADKNLVTALTNFHKKILLENIEEYLLKNPGLVLTSYSDFKSMRFAFSGVRPIKLIDDLNHLLNFVSKDFETKVLAFKDISSLKNEAPKRWFNAGTGESADEAGLAVRKARLIQRDYQLANFSRLYPELIEQLLEIELKRERLFAHLKKMHLGDSLFEDIEGLAIFKREVFELLRKYSDQEVAQIGLIFERELNLKLDPTLIDQMLSYYQLVDSFTPGLWIENRTLVNLDQAKFGGFAADFKGMGARNIQQAAIDLAQNSHDLTDALKALRKGEKKVTEYFEKKKKMFKEEVTQTLHLFGIKHQANCSGDDCVSVLENPIDEDIQKEVTKSLAQSQGAASLRLSFIPPNVASMDRSLLAVHGELIEKGLRKSVVGPNDDQISFDVLNKLSFAVSMPSQYAKGPVHLIIVESDQYRLKREQRQLLFKHFKKVIRKLNHELSHDWGGPFLYQAGKLI